METSARILNQFPSITSSNQFHHSSKLSCSCSKSSVMPMGLNLKSNKLMGLNLESKKLMGSCGFYDEGYLEYYSSSGRVRCGKKEKNKDNDVALKKKMKKKKMKLFKGLSEMGFGFGSDNIALVDQIQGKTISEAADLLLGQLQQQKAEEKELKRKRKEEKALMKMKGTTQIQRTRKCEMSSSSSSSSESSDSSDDECRNLVDMKSLKLESLAQTIPKACDRALENATLSPNISTVVEPLNPEVDTSVEFSTTSTSSFEVPVREQKGECCLQASDCHIGNVGSSSTNASVLATTTEAGAKKIEVCMGGKCKRAGAGAILEKFQQVVGIEATVSGCKCMGKCKVGPNVKVSGSNSSIPDAFQASDSVSVSSAPTTSSNSLCIGVGLEDVSLIATNLLGRHQEVGLVNAMP